MVLTTLDAMTDVSREAYDDSLTRIPKLGETGTTREVIALLNTQGAA
jgi:hypothetical protein